MKGTPEMVQPVQPRRRFGPALATSQLYVSNRTTSPPGDARGAAPRVDALTAELRERIAGASRLHVISALLLRR
jgi:hypothetical protein